MKDSKPTDKARIARLRAAGMTVQEIGNAVGLSKQRVSQILASEPLPPLGERVQVSIEGDRILVTGDTETRIMHATVVNAFRKLGIEVQTRTRA